MLTNPQDSLQAAGVKDRAHPTSVVQQVPLAASCKAFAAWCRGGSRILTWGDPIFGGDCSAVQEHLQTVQRVQGMIHVFVGIVADGSVATWGRPDCFAVQAEQGAFAAILADGSVVTWGYPRYGGDCTTVQDQLVNVQQIQATGFAFAAILVDGSVVAWGLPDFVGDCSAVQDQFHYF